MPRLTLGDLSFQLTDAVEGAGALALGAAFVWGVLSVILSPCHLASIPLVVGFIGDQGETTPRRALWLSTLFALGILCTIALVGIITASMGRLAGNLGSWAYYVTGGVMILVGLHLLDVVPLPLSPADPSGAKRRGPLAAFMLGLVFGLALGPCTFAYMAPMLAVTFQTSGTSPVFGGALLLAYGIGHCGVIAAAGGSTGLVQRFMDWQGRTGGATWLKRICGALVIAGGLYMLYLGF